MRFPALLAFALLSPLLAESQEVRPYAGKYAGDPRCEAFLGELPAQMRAAARAMSERLGLPPADAANVVLELVDRPLGPQKDVVLGGTMTKSVGGRIVQWITLNPESHFAAVADFEQELAHEMTHALLRNALGDANHRLLPKWAREGLAVWAAGQGPGRVAFWLTIHWDKPDPVAVLLNGLENEKHALEDYPEDYLAVEAIETEKGVEGVRAFVRLLAAGKPCHDAAAEASGRTWDEFAAFAASYADERIRAALGDEEFAAWKRAMALLRVDRDFEAAQRAFYAVAARFPDSWAGALGMYYFGRALQMAGLPADAGEALREFFAVAGPRTGLMDDAVWNMALCEEKAGDVGAAIASFDRLARDFSYSPQAPPGLLRAAGLCEAAGRGEEARARYERIVKDLAGTKEAEEAAKKLGALPK